jgi:hypothetical protein
MASLGEERPLRAGFLAAPLGWLNQCLAKILASDRELFATLFELDPYRMHVLGLGIAHLDPALLSRTIIEDLASRSPQASVREILRSWPRGLNRILHALPDTSVLAPENYRALVRLLDDRTTAAHLHHCRAVNEPLITALAALPSPLRRPAIYKLFDNIDGMDRLIAGLQYLSDRAGVAFDCLVEELSSLGQADQVKAKIAGLADRLPLPDRLPAQRLGTFHRIDDPAQIRSLAKSWRNCLSEYLHEVNEGSSLIYRSTEDDMPAAARLVRADRLGWALVDIKGPHNSQIHEEAGLHHYAIFADAGIPKLADIAAIRSILWRSQFPRR